MHVAQLTSVRRGLDCISYAHFSRDAAHHRGEIATSSKISNFFYNGRTTLQSRLLDRICPSPEEGKVNDGDIGGVAGTACDRSIDDRRECEDGARLLPNMELGFLKKVNTAQCTQPEVGTF